MSDSETVPAAGAADDGWYWWAGWIGEVECEATYRHGEFLSRGEAIRAALADPDPYWDDADGEPAFCLIEAQFGDVEGGEGDPDDFQPFGPTRNAETLTYAAARALIGGAA
jgi:hypothetical protein